jgi:large subunit ribosomal protein L25
MAQSQTIKAERREKLGTHGARRLRSAGRIPANLQSEGEHAHVDFSLDEAEFLTSRRQHVHLYDIDLGGEVESAVVRELQWDALGESILHIEFKRVQRGVETEAEVELEFVGTPKHGMVNHLVTHVTVLCLPSLIPDSIEVKVGDLAEGEHVRAKDLLLPEGVKLAIPADTEVAVISGTPVVDLEAPSEEEGEAGDVEIIGEEKDEEESED